MLSSLMLMLMTQTLVCTPGETTLVCHCKAGMVNACVALAGEDALTAGQVLDELQTTLEQAAWMAGKEGENQKRQAQTAADSLSEAVGNSEPPNCKGQEHHIISRSIAQKLSKHATLKGLYTPRDPRFVARARDEQDHCGYQGWHRDVDNEVIDWLQDHSKATPEEFMAKLREIYNRPEMQAKFPNGF